jgi:hypothetical protein
MQFVIMKILSRLIILYDKRRHVPKKIFIFESISFWPLHMGHFPPWPFRQIPNPAALALVKKKLHISRFKLYLLHNITKAIVRCKVKNGVIMIRPMMGHRAKPKKFDLPLRYYNPEEDE